MKWVQVHIILASIILFTASYLAFGNASIVGFLGSDFFLQAAPVMNNPVLNSTFGANFTNENLTCYTNATDADGDQVTYRGFWFRNGKPYFYSWIDILGRTGVVDSQPIQGVAVDSFDNIAAAGKTYISGKSTEFFVAKFNENGTQLWNRSGGTIRSEDAADVAIDSQDNIIAAGSLANVTTTQIDVWVWKLDSSGNFLWNATSGYPSKPEWVTDVAVDGNDNITVVGYNETEGTIGGTSIYLWKFNSTGSKLWERTIRAPGRNNSMANGVAIDSNNNITITGFMLFTMGMTLTPVSQVYTAKLDPSGNLIKNVTFNISGANGNTGGDVAIDSQDNIIVVGGATFGSIYSVPLIIKYDSNLVHLWNTTLNLTGKDSAGGVAIDDEDNIYITGTINGSTRILLAKFDTNGNQLWNFNSSYGSMSQGRAIAIDSKNYIILGGRNVNISDLGFVLKYYGFENIGQTQGVLVNSSTIPESVTEVGDVWMCDSRALDATAKTTYLQSNNLTIRNHVPTAIECSINVPNNFSNCTNLVFFDNITEVRANCSGAVNATFNLTNLFDNTNFIYATTTTASGDFLVLDNSDVQILDSGNWSLNAFCDYGTIQGNDTANFFIPFGNITVTMLTGNQNVINNQTFNVTTRLLCTGGECLNNSVVLDPIISYANLTGPGDAVHSVLADSEFIYGASEDNNLYVWNKTSLNLYATLSDTNGLLAMHADSDYIYAGGWSQNLLIWNRTDYVTPFASVYNISSIADDISSIVSDDNYIYVGCKYGFGYLQVFNKTDPSFQNVRNLSGPANIVRDLAIDDTYLYAVTHSSGGYGRLFIYNRTNLSQSIVRGSCSNCNIKAVGVDNTYIYTFGGKSSYPYTPAFLIAWYKSNFSVAYNNTNYFSNGEFLAGDKGGYGFTYGGIESAFTDGSIYEINSSNLSLKSEHNISGWWPKSLYFDEDYLYAGMMNNGYTQGMVSLFTTVPIRINSLSVVPTFLPIPSTAYCSANITNPGTIANLTFTVTYPTGTVVPLSYSNVNEIYNSSTFNVNIIGKYECNVTAVNTNHTTDNACISFLGGLKGVIPMNSGSPFYTTSQNPRNGTQEACLLALLPSQHCDSNWTVTANGTAGQTFFFFATYNSNINTSSINVTITQKPTPPTPSTGGTGGGGSQYVNVPPVQEIQSPSICVENWACGDWSDCEGGVKTRSCYDYNSCKSEKFKPVLSEECVVPESVVVQKTVEVEGVSSDVKLKTVSAPETEVNPLIVKLVVSALVVFGIILLLSAVLFTRRPSAPVDIPLPKMEKFEFRALTKKKN